MTYITTTFPFRAAVNDSTFDHPNHSYSQGPTNVRQNYYPLVPNCYPGSLLLHDPLHHAPVVPVPPILIAESEHYALYDLDMSVLSPNYLDSLPEQLTAPVSSFANGEPPYNIAYASRSHLHQADETISEALPAPRPSGFPYSSAPLTTQRPRSLPEPTNVAFNGAGAFDQNRIQAAIHPPSTSTTVHEFGGNTGALSAPPLLLAAANPTTDHSNTVHICQYVTGGLPCNATVMGNHRSVRDHLNRVHGFRGVGKDTVECLWAGCEKRLQRENITRHIVTCHLRVKVGCVGCGLPLSRSDVQYSHAKVCSARRWQTVSRLD